MPMRVLDAIGKRIEKSFLALTVEGRCYSIGIAVLCFAGVLALIGKPEAGFVAQGGSLLFALGLLPLIEQLYEWAWETLLGKLIIAAVVALATNMAYGFGRQMVAELVGTSPEPFAATVNVATILLSPVLFLMILAIGGIFIFIIALYVGMLATMAFMAYRSPSVRKQAIAWICRVVAVGTAVFGSWAFLKHSDGYTGWVSDHAASYLYTFDMYHDAQQADGKGEKVAVLPDGRILIGTKKHDEGYTFVARQTASIAKDTTTEATIHGGARVP